MLLTKRLGVDVLPLLQAPSGWVQEKLEGLTVANDGRAYAVTDNDGLDDATGATVFLRLRRLRRYPRCAPAAGRGETDSRGC